ncbi:hypothetical protein GCM10009682_19260 [Luedemannella flava]|uniref:DUF4367 domain-containing protein n=1 Tax=Luedemannella flava TaxID=349316 RepID=A0ABP4Y0X8_9ACTN
MTQDELIRAAFARAADFTPDEQAVRRTLLERDAKRRGRRTMLFAGGLAAAATGAAAVGLPIVLRSSRDPDVTYPPDIPMGDVPASGNLRAAMALRPTYLPAGVRETVRMASLGMPTVTQVRSWFDGDVSVRLDLGHYEGSGPLDDTTRITTINGLTAWSNEAPDESRITWLINPRAVARLTVRGLSDAAEVARRVARSVTADRDAAVEVPVRFGWLPAGIPRDQMTIAVTPGPSGDRYYEVATASVDSDTYEVPRQFSLSFVPKPEVSAGEPVTVRGRQGSYSRGTLSVQHTDGRWLVLNAAAEEPLSVLVRVVNEVQIGPEPANDWFGTR